MKRTILERRLKEALNDKYIKSEEYQDKYFLMRKIQTVLPDFSDALIYETIEKCNTQLDSPIKRDEFIKTFLNQIIPILYEKI